MLKNKNFYTNCSVWGNYILYRGVRDGKRINERIEYRPTLFTPTLNYKESKHQTLDGTPVEKIQPGTIGETRDFLQQYEGVEGFKIYGNTYFNYCYLSDTFPGEIDYDSEDILIANLDIETGSENGFPEPDTAREPVISITVKLKNCFFVMGCGDFDETKVEHKVKYKKFSCERDLLMGFIDFWSKNYPDAITGWFTSGFDIPYLVNRITKVCGESYAKKLSPWGKFTQRSVTLMGRTQQMFSLVGISQLDYMELFKKYAPNNNQESYKLDNIAYVILGERKASFEEYGNLRNLYKQNYQKFIEYNIQDVNLVDKLDAKLKLIDLVLKMAYDAKVNYDDVFGQVKVWDTLIFNELRKKNIVVPQKREEEKEYSYAGAYVKDPIVGFHKWVATFDINSLYPSLIQMFNISPDAICDHCDPEKVTIDDLLERKFDTKKFAGSITMAANGYTFQSNFTGFLSEMMKRMYNERKEYKNKSVETKKELQRVKEEVERRKI